MGAFALCTLLSYGQEVLWQKDIPSSTQDFLSQVTTTIDGQYLITGSPIQSIKQKERVGKGTSQFKIITIYPFKAGEKQLEMYLKELQHPTTIEKYPQFKGVEWKKILETY
ncbi:hypothetical protein SAMN05880574_10311 [Chryseobacterium sp. RU37D]|nr:hypothetical protein SAMN05880574_10311 [Chryseobacterium sp. RU37D]